MFRRTRHLELPRRVAVYFVLFCTAAVAWLAVSVVVISRSTLRSKTEDRCLAQLERAAATAIRELPRNGQANLQPLVVRYRSENSLAYCAIVSSDGRYRAHSSRKLVGKVHSEPEGARVFLNDKLMEQQTPLILPDLSLGNYKVHIEKDGYLPQDLSISLSVNEFNPVLVKLKPSS